MPFAKQRRLVSRILHDAGQQHLPGAVPARRITRHSVLVTMLTGEYRRTTRATDGVSTKTVAKYRALTRYAIHIRCVIDAAIIRTDRTVCMIIGEDEDDVGALFFLRKSY